MNQKIVVRAFSKILRAALLSSVLLFQFAGAVEPASAGNPPVIDGPEIVTRLISRNGTPYAFQLTLHASDPEGGNLFWTLETSPAHGSADVGSTTPGEAVVTYAPNTDYAGPDAFVVKVLDQEAKFDTVQVQVNVAPGIGVVFATDEDSHGRNDIVYDGIVRADTELGVTKSLYYPVVVGDYLPMLLQCSNEGNVLCFGVGEGLSIYIDDAALAKPATKFATVDVPLASPPGNLRAIAFGAKESGYLAGALAGKMTTTNIIGYAGGEADYVEENLYVIGYRNGAQCANPNVNVLIRYAGSFIDETLGAQTAQQLIALNADVIFAPSGPTGFGAIGYTAEHGRWVIGSDLDQYYNYFGGGAEPGANKILTSALKYHDNAVFDTVDDIMAGVFTSGTVRYGLALDGVGLAPYHDAEASIPLAVKTYVNDMKAGLISGAVDKDFTCRFTGKSAGAQDGWVLEASETGGTGGTLNSALAYSQVGDDSMDRQYRSILSFNTTSLPDNAIITKVTLKIRRQAVLGTDPFSTHGNILVDIRKGVFSGSASLQVSDFQAAPNGSVVGTLKSPPLAGGWYQAVLLSAAYPYINRTGITQFRLRFARDDNDDLSVDTLKFYSGNAGASYQPQLIISYRQP